jgi:hypothetical protein
MRDLVKHACGFCEHGAEIAQVGEECKSETVALAIDTISEQTYCQTIRRRDSI